MFQVKENGHLDHSDKNKEAVQVHLIYFKT